ncbi:MAG TPA: hypothetical protein VFK86_09295 [Bauldia sp.]|nr:hypothetical protein [Bauldia sp.]
MRKAAVCVLLLLAVALGGGPMAVSAVGAAGTADMADMAMHDCKACKSPAGDESGCQALCQVAAPGDPAAIPGAGVTGRGKWSWFDDQRLGETPRPPRAPPRG